MRRLTTLERLLSELPEEEHEHVELHLRHQLVLLSVMPSEQRYQTYAEANLAMMHHARFAVRADEPTEKLVLPKRDR